MAKHIKISEERKKEIEKNYRKFYTECKRNNKKITFNDVKRYLPKPLVKREYRALQEGGSYYLDFLIPVNERASGKCELTGIESKNLQIHHLDSYEFRRNGRLDPKNAIALCNEAHQKFHKIYGYHHTNRQQFEVFARDVKNGKIKIYKDL